MTFLVSQTTKDNSFGGRNPWSFTTQTDLHPDEKALQSPWLVCHGYPGTHFGVGRWQVWHLWVEPYLRGNLTSWISYISCSPGKNNGNCWSKWIVGLYLQSSMVLFSGMLHHCAGHWRDMLNLNCIKGAVDLYTMSSNQIHKKVCKLWYNIYHIQSRDMWNLSLF